jgi:membrane-associated phospholipid phosphatase
MTEPAASRRPKTLALISAGAGVSFVSLTLWIARHGGADPGLDLRVHSWVVEHRSAGSLTLARTVTWGGVTTVVLPALIVVGAVAEKSESLQRRIGSGLVLAGVASVGVYLGLRVNALVGRVRPPFADWAGSAGGPSFPSGHTTAAALFAASCAWAVSVRLGPGWPRRVLWGGAVVYAAAVGWSRIWLGVHWPTDVLGSGLFAATWCTGTAAALLALRRRSSRRRMLSHPS